MGDEVEVKTPPASEIGANAPGSEGKPDETIQESLSEHLSKTVEGFKAPELESKEGEDDKEKAKLDEHKDETEEEKTAREAKEAEEGKKKDEEEGEKADDKDKDKEPEPGKPVPYERFAEINEQKNSFKRQLDDIQPVVQNYRNITEYCANSNITPDQFNQALKVQALLNTNPAEALKHLEPIVDSLKGLTGDRLPADLQKRVDEGKLELDDAKRIAKLEAELKHGKAVGQQTEQQRQMQAQRQFQQDCAREAQVWEKAKRSSDPDYSPKKKDSEPDGKWEDVRDKYLAMLNQIDANGNHVNVVRSPGEMAALMSRAYDSVNQKWARFTGAAAKNKTRKPLTSNGAPATEPGKIEDAKTLREAIAIGISQRVNR